MTILTFMLVLVLALTTMTVSMSESKSKSKAKSREIISIARGYLPPSSSMRDSPYIIHQLSTNTSDNIKCATEDSSLCSSFGGSHCCKPTHVCCKHGCCPSAFPRCSAELRLCLNDENKSLCVGATKSNNNINDNFSTFIGSVCSTGSCCGKDPNYPYCPIASSKFTKNTNNMCVNGDGYVPCMFNSTLRMPGIPCINQVTGIVNSCCPKPLKCCNDGRCCNRPSFNSEVPKRTGIPIETVIYNDIIMGVPPLNISLSPSPSFRPSPSVNDDEVVPNFVQVKPSLVFFPTSSPSTSKYVIPIIPSFSTFPSVPNLDIGMESTTSTPSLSPSPSPSFTRNTSNRRRECFPGSVSVNVIGKGKMQMKHLNKEHDDVIQTNDKHGASGIVTWTHRKSKTKRKIQYIKIYTVNGKYLTATSGHFIYVCNGNDNEKLMKAVGDVGVDVDSLCFVDVHHNNEIRPVKVIGVEKFWSDTEGLYNPQTFDGTIVVNDFLCTCYTTAVDSILAHTLLAPLRALANLFTFFSPTYLSSSSYAIS